MRSIYLGKRKALGKKRCKNCSGTPEECLKKFSCLAEPVAPVRKKYWFSVLDCRSCGGPQIAKPVGFTLAGEAVYSCRDPWHVRIGQ